jgi:hypothetical protein
MRPVMATAEHGTFKFETSYMKKTNVMNLDLKASFIKQ